MAHNSWDINPNDFPHAGTVEDKIRFWLRYAILAPSAHNVQPWQWEMGENTITIARDPDFILRVADPTLKETIIGVGAFIETLLIAANHWGYRGEVTDVMFRTTDPHVARITFNQGTSDEGMDGLFTGITQRHTNRGKYELSLDAQIISQLTIPASDGLKLATITSPDAKERISQLVGKGTFIALSMRGMVEELAELVSREDEHKSVGMAVESMAESIPANVAGSDWVLRHMDPQEESQYWQDGFATAPVVAIVATELDGPEAWVAAGRLMQRLLLKAATLELVHCISAAPVEIPTLAPLLRKEIDPEYRPQVLIRLGKPLNPAFTKLSNRRNVI